MVSKRRLLILSCSQRKHSSPGLLPAIERYNGPTFFVLRRFLKECPDKAGTLDVYILSAAYGLIPADRPIAFYDRKMNASRAAGLRGEVLGAFTRVMQDGYDSLCLVMGKTYLTALTGWEDSAPANLKLTVAEGTIGVKLAQLKHWLRERQSQALC